MIPRPSSAALCATGLGLVAGLTLGVPWSPASKRDSGPMLMAAASQYLVGAEARRAGPVLTSSTTEQDAPQVDGWLRRVQIGAHRDALRVILNHPAPMLRQRWVKVLFVRWASVSREEALQAALGIESPALRLTALDAVLDIWMQRNARGAWDHVLTMTDPLLQSHAIEHLLDACATSQPDACLTWAESLTDPFLRRKAVEQIAHAWVRRDANACWKWAQTVEDVATRRAALGIVVTQLSAGDPQPAFAAAMTEPDLASRRELLTVAMQNVSFARLPVALTWLRTNQASLDSTLQPTMRVLGATLANDRQQTAQLPLLARSLASAPLTDSLLAGAAMRLISQGATGDARRLLAAIGPGIEREEVSDALARR